MRFVVILFVSILALTWTPGLVSAQGLFGCSDVGSSGGLPILGKLFGKKNKAVSCYDDPPRGGGVAFYIGYLDNDRGVAFDITPDGAFGAGGANAGIAFEYPISGVLFAGSGTIPISERLDILVNGSWLLPSGGGEATYVWDNRAAPDGTTTYSTKNQWWNVGAAATFNIAGPFSAMGGVMLDSFMTTLTSPSDIGNALVTDKDEGDLTVTTIIPYLGALLTQGGSAGSLTIGMIGFPLIFGDAKFTDTWNFGAAGRGAEISGGINSGYFFEIFAETSVNVRAMSFGIFGGWSATAARMSMDFDYSNWVGGAQALADSQPYSGSFYRSAWVVGGKFALDFVSPL